MGKRHETGAGRAFGAMVLAAACSAAIGGEWSGNVAAELRVFTEAAAHPGQHGDDFSFSLQPEYYHAWEDGRRSVLFVPFLRVDQSDPQRTHFDIRELTWVRSDQDWELRVGVRKLFWGVTESQHLVDIINQTDLVEDPDGEEKLGQPMVNLAWIGDWGTVDLFVLPGFRERTFPAREGRLRFSLPVDVGRALYDASNEDRHIDAAVRWSRTFGDWDVGLAHFSGTGREPRFVPAFNAQGAPVALLPKYDLIDQTSADVQATKGSWLWKLEVISRNGQGDRFTALTGGFEYTFTGVFDSAVDVGLLTEYLFDDRGARASTPFDDDVFAGARITLNDVQSTELLAGVIGDRNKGTRLFSLEASRRFGDSWKLSLTARIYAEVARDDLLFDLRNDDYVQLELARYF